MGLTSCSSQIGVQPEGGVWESTEVCSCGMTVKTGLFRFSWNSEKGLGEQQEIGLER